MIEKVILRNKSRLLDALEVCEQGILEHPNSGPLFTTKGSILLMLNRTEEAVSYLEPVVQSKLRIANANYHLGVAYQRLGMKEDAVNSFRGALRIDPGHVTSLFDLGKLLQATGDSSKLQEAETL